MNAQQNLESINVLFLAVLTKNVSVQIQLAIVKEKEDFHCCPYV